VAIAEAVLLACLAYAVCGLAVGLPFVFVGVGRVDAAAQGAPLSFRLLILPGAAALWPVLLAKWLKAPGSNPA
jgi:hypothetical protein